MLEAWFPHGNVEMGWTFKRWNLVEVTSTLPSGGTEVILGGP